MDTKTYYIRHGDTLAKIGRYFGMSVAALLELNPQVSEAADLKSLEQLTIPARKKEEMGLHQALAVELFPQEKPWLAIALREAKTIIKEWEDPRENPVILEYLESVGIGNDDEINGNTGDEILWCSAFVNWCLTQAGLKGTNSGLAKSWDGWGLTLEESRKGCIVRLHLKGGNHVGFYLEDYPGEKLSVLGGNQSNQVRESHHYLKKEAVCYRWPGGSTS